MARQKKPEEETGHSAASSSKAIYEQEPSTTPRPPVARRTRRHPQRKQERQGLASAPVRPASEETDGTNTNIKLVHPRLLTKNLDNQEALVHQRREYGPDLSRRTFDRGDRIVSALGPADQETGRRGTYESRGLAEELIGDINQLIEFALLNGQVPTRIQALNECIHTLEDIRSLLRGELQSILQPIIRAEVRMALQDLLPQLQSGTLASGGIDQERAENKAPQGLLTEVDPQAQGMLANLFDE